jgi:hypothetical protein
MTTYLLGVDLAQASDYTAIGIVETVPPAERGGDRVYHLRHLERLRGISYVAIAAHVRDLVAALRTTAPPRPAATVVYDRTGVGAAVGDVLDRAGIDAPLVGVSIHGGDRATWEAGIARVPKRDLVAALVVAFQNGALRIAAGLGLAPVLTAELQNFRLKFNPLTAHDSYSAWREDQHDDLVLAVSLAVWYGERFTPPPAAVPYAAPHASRWQRPVWSMPPRPCGERQRFR